MFGLFINYISIIMFVYYVYFSVLYHATLYDNVYFFLMNTKWIIQQRSFEFTETNEISRFFGFVRLNDIDSND